MNKNYVKGRAFEYRIMKRWGGPGSVYKTLRSSGSHSPFDVVAYTKDMSQFQYLRTGTTREVTKQYIYTTTLTPIVGLGIQCKVKKNRAKVKHECL